MTMGNLLNTPITEKDTHVGRTVDQHSILLRGPRPPEEKEDGGGGVSVKKRIRNGEKKRDSEAPTPSIDGGGLYYGISSMQGYRMNMEDAHIVQPFLFAEEILGQMDASFAKGLRCGIDDDGDNVAVGRIVHPLHNHSLFAIFDGHGGKFPADYASRNFLRILSRNSNFIAYTLGWNRRERQLRKKKAVKSSTCSMNHKVTLAKTATATTSNMTSTNSSESLSVYEVDNDNNSVSNSHSATAAVALAAATATSLRNNSNDTYNNNNDKDVMGAVNTVDEQHQQLCEAKKRGHECDVRIHSIRDQVHRCSAEDVEDDINDGVEEKEDEEEDDDAFDKIITDNGDESTSGNPREDDNGEKKEQENKDSVCDDEWYINDRNLVNSLSYDCRLMHQLRCALSDAFLDLDAELLAEMRGDNSTSKDVNTPYGTGYELNALVGCSSTTGVGKEEGGEGEYFGVGHLPKEFGSNDAAAASIMEDKADNNNRDDDRHKSSRIEFNTGTTAVVVLITPKWIVCANAGDSRAVFSRSSHRSVPLSYDHKPGDEAEERRIRSAGGYVAGGRIEGDLAVSRGLGDYRFKELDVVATGARGENRQEGTQGAVARGGVKDAPKMRPSEQKVSSVPDIIFQDRDPEEDEFIVLACDGIWDVQTNQECVSLVAKIFAEGESDMGLVCEEILDQCLMKGSKDNMTAAVIKFPKQAIGKGRGVIEHRERRRASSSSKV